MSSTSLESMPFFRDGSLNSFKSDPDRILIKIHLHHSSLLRGTSLQDYHTVMSLSRADIFNWNTKFDYKYFKDKIETHFSNILLNDKTNNLELDKVVHYFYSKKLHLMIFRKSKSRGNFAPLYYDNDYETFKKLLKIKNKFVISLAFVKQSTMKSLGSAAVNDAILKKWAKSSPESSSPILETPVTLDSLKLEDDVSKIFYDANTSNRLSNSSSSVSSQFSFSNRLTSSMKPENNSSIPYQCSPNIVSTSGNLFFSKDEANSSSSTPESHSESDYENILNLIKSFLDPFNASVDKQLGNVLSTVNEIRTTFSTSIEPINEKLDELCSSLTNYSLQEKRTDHISHPSKTEETHSNVYCDNCNSKIKGFRFKCMQCEDFDLCEKCDLRGCEILNHNKYHQMLRVSKNEFPIVKSLSDSWSALPGKDKVITIDVDEQINDKVMNSLSSAKYREEIEKFTIDYLNGHKYYENSNEVNEKCSTPPGKEDGNDSTMNTGIDEAKVNNCSSLNPDNYASERSVPDPHLKKSIIKMINNKEIVAINDENYEEDNKNENFIVSSMYVLDFNTNQVKAVVLPTNPPHYYEYVYMHIKLTDGSLLTSQLLPKEQKFEATFLKGNNDILNNIESQSFSYKLHDLLEIEKNKEERLVEESIDEVPDMTEKSSLTLNSNQSNVTSTEATSKLLIPSLESFKEQGYIVISKEETIISDVDDEDYDILSCEEL